MVNGARVGAGASRRAGWSVGLRTRAGASARGRWLPPTPPPLRRSLGLYQDEEDEAGWWLVGWWVVCDWWWVAGGRPAWMRKMTVGGCGGWWWVVSGCPAPPHHVPKHCTYHPPPMFLRHVVGWVVCGWWWVAGGLPARVGGLWFVLGRGWPPCPALPRPTTRPNTAHSHPCSPCRSRGLYQDEQDGEGD